MKHEPLKPHFKSFLTLILFALAGIGSIDNDEVSSSLPSSKRCGGNTALDDLDRGTTFQQQKHKANVLHKRFEFSGKVEDVVSRTDAKVKIHGGYRAFVHFSDDISSLDGGQTILFEASIYEFGDGTLIPHVLNEASLLRQ